MGPGTTTRALIPRRFSARPGGELTKRSASAPNRAENLAQPVCGASVTSMTAVSPIATRVPGGSSAAPRWRSTKSWSPAKGHRSWSTATRVAARAFMSVSWRSGSAERSGVLRLPRSRQLSPTSPSSRSSSAVVSTSRSSTTGRRTIISNRPDPIGERATSPSPAVSSSVLRCDIGTSSHREHGGQKLIRSMTVDLAPHLLEAAPQEAGHVHLRHAHAIRDLALRELLVEPQADDLALAARKPADQLADDAGVGDVAESGILRTELSPGALADGGGVETRGCICRAGGDA